MYVLDGLKVKYGLLRPANNLWLLDDFRWLHLIQLLRLACENGAAWCCLAGQLSRSLVPADAVDVHFGLLDEFLRFLLVPLKGAVALHVLSIHILQNFADDSIL